jgi:hypothetical protein
VPITSQQNHTNSCVCTSFTYFFNFNISIVIQLVCHYLKTKKEFFCLISHFQKAYIRGLTGQSFSYYNITLQKEVNS